MPLPIRARFGGDVLAEVLLADKKAGRTALLLGGLPSTPAKTELMEYLRIRGYTSVLLRYRGTWESGGEFLKTSPLKDLKDTLRGLESGFIDLWEERSYKIKTNKLLLICSSFGGSVGIDALADSELSKKITAVIAFSPVTDWRIFSSAAATAKEERFLKLGYGPVYRYKKSNMTKLWQGKLINPASHLSAIDGKRLLIIQAKDDEAVPWRSSGDFAAKSGSQLLLVNKGGHFGVSEFMNSQFRGTIDSFLKKALK